MKINEIGYFKYETNNTELLTKIPYYPINNIILKEIKHIKYEFENNKPKKINGKFVVLV